ncbi:ion transporter [Lentisphaera marina]|uniref:ion transporter n=1 Tax=Lentisphaera marina TaxID=1111041 RepID=UPI0023654335|nr:ion transporter [Lentisphaera marina]MDD7984365.1 ion transporter [Lentisphaera marina]
MKQKIFSLLMQSPGYRRFSSLMILIYVTGLILFSIPAIREQMQWIKSLLLTGIGIFFTIEYMLRVYSCNADGSQTRRQWMKKPYSIIDLLAIGSFLLGSFMHFDLLFLRTLHLVSAMPVKGSNSSTTALDNLLAALRSKIHDLFACLGLLINLMIIASCALYCFEHEVQPDKFSSIPASLWWAVSTVSTVGYGDIYPVTIGGKIVAGIFAIIGFGFIALPAGIMTAAYIEAAKKSPPSCPHCGHDLKK